MRTFLFISFSICLISFVSTPYALLGQPFETSKGHAEVEGATSVTTYTGETDQLEGAFDLNADTLYFELPLKSIKTGISLRDDHMRDALEVDKYPKTRFSGKIVDGFPEKGETVQTTVRGDYTIHGVTKKVEVTGTTKWQGDRLMIKGSFPIKITEYDIEPPSVMFMTVYDEHEIRIDVTLKQ